MRIFTRRVAIMGAIAAFVTACTPSKFRRYNGPEVTRIQVFKNARVMQLLHNDTQLKAYKFNLGFAPEGHKEIEGDGRTPEGAYRIDRRNPNSRFHLSLGISYPNADDIAKAKAMGERPGGDIFFHGTPSEYVGQSDWTWGCIAVTNDEMEEMYAMVKNGTLVYIYP